VKLAGAAVLIVLLVTGFAVYRAHCGSAAGSQADAVRDCLRGAGRPASIETSSTGERQVAIAHGPMQVSEHVTIQNSKTYISFMKSPDDAAWWAGQLRQSPDIPDDSVASAGNAFVQYGTGATAADRAAVTSCLG
jgi:hypothetical protein